MRLRCDFYSEALGIGTAMTVLLPQSADGQIGLAATTCERTPVLYLLHGLSDDDTIWTRRTSIERYASNLGLAVVMPQVGRSFYCDEVHGNRYWTFLSEELPALVNSSFNVSSCREDTFVAGLSMGGYGAFKWALRQPWRFAAAAALSGSLDIAKPEREHALPDLFRTIWGEGRRPANTDDDLLTLMARAEIADLPALWVGCGTEDFLLPDTHRFLHAAHERGVHVTHELPPGGHEWSLWDEQIRRVLHWLPLQP